MSYIPEEVVQDIRQKTDIVSVINDYVKLTKKGQNYTASCPFHEDRNPSFSVHAGKQIYKCFSCGRGGNVFSFLQEIEDISFLEAVKKAAELANLPLDSRFFQQVTESNRQDNRLIELHQKVNEFYHYYLMNTTAGEAGYQYLLERGLSPETLETYAVGLSPEDSTILLQYLTDANYSHDLLIKSGIFFQTEQGELLDRFRGRIVFPLRNAKGQIVAFSGRIYTNASSSDKKIAKYLNSPETDIFHKGQLIFNLDLARQKIRQLDQVLICEGFMDVIALHQAGFEHAVATMGTNLTPQHLNQLAKLTQEFVFIFDGDEAGQNATQRALELAKPIQGQRLKVVTIPQKLDPDEWIRQKGRDAFQQLINQALSSYDFYQQQLKGQFNLSDSQQLAQYINQLLQQIATFQSPIERALRLNELAQTYHLDVAILEEQLARQLPTIHKTSKEQIAASSTATDYLQAQSDIIQSKLAFQSEKQLLSALMYYKEAWDFVEQLSEPIILFHSTAQELYFALQKAYYDEGRPLPLTNIVNYIEDPQLHHFVTSLIWDSEQFGYSEAIMRDCLHAIQQAFIELQIEELRQKVALYEKEQRYYDVNELLMTIIQLNRQLKS
ncbi:MAG: DNA primase [Aerococcaceae bacterium]|nr:DNA primase [Aerococcaceae bacterium]